MTEQGNGCSRRANFRRLFLSALMNRVRNRQRQRPNDVFELGIFHRSNMCASRIERKKLLQGNYHGIEATIGEIGPFLTGLGWVPKVIQRHSASPSLPDR